MASRQMTGPRQNTNMNIPQVMMLTVNIYYVIQTIIWKLLSIDTKTIDTNIGLLCFRWQYRRSQVW